MQIKKILSILLVFLILIAITPVAYGANITNSPVNNPRAGSMASVDMSQRGRVEGIIDFEAIENYERNADFTERIVASMIAAPVNALLNIMNLKDVSQLVFNLDENWNISTDTGLTSVLGTAGSGLAQNIYNRIAQVVPFLLVMILVLSGALMMWNLTGKGQEYAKSILAGVFVSGIMLVAAVPFWEMLIRMNHAVTSWAYGQLIAEGLGEMSFLATLAATDSRSILRAIISLFAVFMVGTMNFQYAVRSITLGVLFFMTPLVAAVSILPTKRNVLSTWLTEVFSNIFMQAGHAIALMYFIMMIHSTLSFWVTMAALLSMNAISSLIRSILGLESQQTAGKAGFMSGALGIAALAGTAKLGMRMLSKDKKDEGIISGNNNANSSSNQQSSTDSAVAGSSSTNGTSIPIKRDEISNNTANDPLTTNSEEGTLSSGASYRGMYYSNTSNSAIKTTSPPTKEQEAFAIPPKKYDFSSTRRMAGKIGSGTVKGFGTVALATAGGIAMGAVGQSPAIGVGLGAVAGYKAGTGVSNTTSAAVAGVQRMGEYKKLAKEEGTTAGEQYLKDKGYYHSSQKYSPSQMAEVGRNIAGGAGAVAGELIGNYNRSKSIGTDDAPAAPRTETELKEMSQSYANQRFEQEQEQAHLNQKSYIEQLPEQKQSWEMAKSQQKITELKYGKESAEYREGAKREKEAQLKYEEMNMKVSKHIVYQQQMKSRDNVTKRLESHAKAYRERVKNKATHGFK